MRFFTNAKYPFLEWRRRGLMVAGALMIASIAAMAYNFATTGSWLNYGVDFTGGTLVQVEFNQPVQAEQIRAINPDWQISRFGDENEFLLRMPSFDQQAGQDAATRVRAQLTTQFGADSFEIARTEAVSPIVGEELQQRALLAMLISFVLMLIYLAFRFEWHFGVASVVATIHDVIFTLGVIAILRTEVSVGTVAAFLTIVGYSVNDTIVVFDRVREILNGPRRYGIIETLNRGLNDTLSRTVITSGTTTAVLLSLYLFGGAVIRDFALVLILGVAIGTFSSLFVAPPAVLWLHERWPLKGMGPTRAKKGTRARDAAAV
jgi:preprotein translocase subunit SecF